MHFLLLNVDSKNFVVKSSYYPPFFQHVNVGEVFLNNKKIGDISISGKEYQLFKINMLNYDDMIEISEISYLYFRNMKLFNYLHLNFCKV